VQDALHRLLEVQDHDTALDQLRHRRDHHPLLQELGVVEAQLSEIGVRRREVQATLTELATRQSELEGQADAAGQRVATIEKRLYSGEVAAARDLQAMSEEADHLKARRRELEDHVLEVMEEREPVDAVAAGLDGEIASLEARAAELRAALNRAVAEIEEEITTQLAARDVSGIPEDLLARYERLRQRLGGTGIARLEHGTCQGCHLTLSATELDQIRRAAPDTVVTCEQCGRILVRD